MICERFAPSPTGLLHLGHAYSALTAYTAAQRENGTFLLRIEDIDQPRSKPEFTQAIFDDLAWLGLAWPHPVVFQSARMPAYKTALDRLISLDLCYPCQCTRKDILTALSAPQDGDAKSYGPDGPVYPGTCRARKMETTAQTDALRLDMEKAVAVLKEPLAYLEIGENVPELVQITAETLLNEVGDIVIARKDIGTSYHLAVVVDDAYQNVTHVTRGKDLRPATAIHRLLQALLGYPVPIYRHHRLIRDESGKRLAKRDGARSLQHYRAEGATPQDIRQIAGLN